MNITTLFSVVLAAVGRAEDAAASGAADRPLLYAVKNDKHRRSAAPESRGEDGGIRAESRRLVRAI